MISQPLSTVKRVMSGNGNADAREEKKSKTKVADDDDDGASAATPRPAADAPPSGAAPAPVAVVRVPATALPHQISDDSLGGSNASSETSAGRNWGWFEDVHGPENAFLPEVSAAREGGGNGGGADRKGQGRRAGLLQVGSELMQNLLQAIVEPSRQGPATNTMAVTAPTYVLEESRSSQNLWKLTAGNRPPQPVEERAFFEQMWSQNFTRSKVKYEIPVEVLTASTPISISPFHDAGPGGGGDGGGGGDPADYNLAGGFHAGSGDEVQAAQADVAEAALRRHLSGGNGAVEMYFDPHRTKDYNLKTLGPHQHHHTLVNKKVKGGGEESDLVVVVRGDNVFGTTVSKSFGRVDHKGRACDGIDTVSVSIASYRVVASKRHGKYAQYLVIFCDGNFRNTVGVWKRYSDFSELSRRVSQGHAESCSPLAASEDHEAELLPNAMTSWKLLKKRQRWYRCLDAGYLSLKVFLLERFLHDILFESSHPQLLRDFCRTNSSEASKLNTKC